MVGLHVLLHLDLLDRGNCTITLARRLWRELAEAWGLSLRLIFIHEEVHEHLFVVDGHLLIVDTVIELTDGLGLLMEGVELLRSAVYDLHACHLGGIGLLRLGLDDLASRLISQEYT